jgi:hypothetical protein
LQRDAHVRRYVRDAAVRELVSEHVSGVADHTPFLWCLLMLELWFRQCVADTSLAPAIAGSRDRQAN